MWKYFAENDG